MIRCRECEYCNQSGRQNPNRDTMGRKHYWCKHPLIKTFDRKVFGNRAEGFIGFGENNYKSQLALKTTPRWCPIKS
ncbi:hypothetical protein [Clostridium tertium]|uniref:hypothetical protein n=1 Tax=Clostridium tertium TaxID=1559 RepID=UPI002A82D41E|nr:hypothetical protein [Clostridium tertium]MDY4605278.1 hypothetical protein [Clostridium tertium]